MKTKYNVEQLQTYKKVDYYEVTLFMNPHFLSLFPNNGCVEFWLKMYAFIIICEKENETFSYTKKLKILITYMKYNFTFILCQNQFSATL